MSNLKTTIKLNDVYLEDHLDILNVINRVNDNVVLEFKYDIDEITNMFQYYVKRQIEYFKDIYCYGDIMDPSLRFIDNQCFFSLNLIDDEDSQSDVKFILKELNNHFGINFNHDVDINKLFKVMLMHCPEYDIINLETLVVSVYYKNYNKCWLKLYNESKH